MSHITHEMLVLLLLLATTLGIYLGTHVEGWVARAFNRYFPTTPMGQLPHTARMAVKEARRQSLPLYHTRD